MIALLLTLACGGGEPPAPAAAPAPAPTPPKAAVAPAVEVGPDGPASITVPVLDAVATDAASVEAGAKVFADRGCGGCHKFGAKLVGPDLVGLYARRTVPWVERMILDPGVMVKQDPQAKEMFRSLMVEMPKQNVSNEELPALLAYLKAQGG